MGEKVNPFIEIPQVQLYPGEVMIPLNPYTNEGYIIKPYYYVTNFGRFFSIATGRLEEKMQRMNSDGYLEIQIITDHGQKHLLSHRGVLSSFYPRPDMYELQVDHIFGNKHDNRLFMIQWAANKENVNNAIQNGLTNPRRRLITDGIIIKIMELAKQEYPDDEISELCKTLFNLRISPETIRTVRTGQEIYKDILGQLGIKPIVRREHTSLTQKDYDNVCELFESGITSYRTIAGKLNMNPRTVRGIIERFYGNKEQRKSLQKIEQKEVVKKKDPFVTAPKDLIDQNITIYPVNINTSKLHILNSNYGVTKDGRIFSMQKGNQWTELRQRCDEATNYYCTVGLMTNHGTKQFMVHRIVMATFCPRPDMYDLEVDHIYGDHKDNRVEHLKWVTHEENMQRAASTGLTSHKTPQRAPDEDIIKINQLAWSGKSDEEISKIMNNKYSPNNVKIIRTGIKTYRPVLEKLGLTPYVQQIRELEKEKRIELKEYIDSRKDKQGLMELYDEVAKIYHINPSTARKIYKE